MVSCWKTALRRARQSKKQLRSRITGEVAGNSGEVRSAARGWMLGVSGSRRRCCPPTSTGVVRVVEQGSLHPGRARAQSYLTLADSVDSSPPGSSVQRISQARTLEQVVPCPSPGDLPNPGITTKQRRLFTATWISFQDPLAWSRVETVHSLLSGHIVPSPNTQSARQKLNVLISPFVVTHQVEYTSQRWLGLESRVNLNLNKIRGHFYKL